MWWLFCHCWHCNYVTPCNPLVPIWPLYGSACQCKFVLNDMSWQLVLSWTVFRLLPDSFPPIFRRCLSCAALFKYTLICQFWATPSAATQCSNASVNPTFMKLVIFLLYACQFLLRLWEVFIRYGELYGNFAGCRLVVVLKCIGLNWRQFSAGIIAGLLQCKLVNIQYGDVWKCLSVLQLFTIYRFTSEIC